MVPAIRVVPVVRLAARPTVDHRHERIERRLGMKCGATDPRTTEIRHQWSPVAQNRWKHGERKLDRFP